MKKLLVASTFLAGMIGHAMAADAIVQEPIVEAPAVFNWTGAYIGGQVGYLWGDADFVSTAGVSSPEPDGWLGGVYVGYNYQFYNNVVLGVDADFAWSGAKDTAPAFPGGSLEVKEEWTGAVRARLGYAVERFLPYIAGGVAFGKLEGSAYDPAGVYQGSDSDTNVGWTLGVGLEYAFTDNFIGRAEYRYTDLGDFDGSIGPDTSTTDYTSSDVRFGIAYKF